MDVRPIPKKLARTIVEAKHYKPSMGIAWETFALYNDDDIKGVVVYGQPSPSIQEYAFEDRQFRLYELTRLVVDRGVTNGGSMLVGRSLQQLSEQPSAVVSYADTAMGHCGIVYQATNWLYTGSAVAHDSMYEVEGQVFHSVSLRDKFGVTAPKRWAEENDYEVIPPQPKHRYFYLNGTSRETREMREKLNYDVIEEYPKKDKTCYDDGKNCEDYLGSVPDEMDIDELFSL